MNRITHLIGAVWLTMFVMTVSLQAGAMGERFHFVREQASAGAPPQTDATPLSGDYLGQPPPGAEPVVFAPGMVSTTDNEHSAPAFSPDGNEVFWFANRPPGPANKEWLHFARTMRRENGRWTAPSASPFDGMLVFSPKGRRVYFASRDDIWVAGKQGGQWSEPRCLGLITRWPELKAVYMPSVTRTGTLYFIGHARGGLRNDFGIYRSDFVNGEYAKPQLLPRGINLAPFLNWAPFVAPDESYLLFSSNRRDPDNDPGDLYISRRLADGSWADPVSLGAPVNTPRQEVFPGLSPNGKYLFFCRETPGRGNDVYWVSTRIINNLQRTQPDPTAPLTGSATVSKILSTKTVADSRNIAPAGWHVATEYLARTGDARPSIP